MPKTIVTVDDAATMRKLIGFMLKQAGYEVLEASDGVAGLQLLSSRAADLIITDINMPLMGGIELTRSVRQLPQHRTTPILVVTTESEAGVKAQAKAVGANGWIVKPFQPDQLVEIVKRVLKT
jgi:two-component system, chemotaxis family, chemotaxis protein CheY